jgi:hypothetical protein
MCCCWMSVLFTRRVQQGPKRPGRRSPHMNRRAFRLVLFVLVIATMGALLAPAVAIADPIGDKQAEAAQLEAQINSNAEKLSGLNERINSAQNELDKANADIQTADGRPTRRRRLHTERFDRRGRGARFAERAGAVDAAEVQLARRAARQGDRQRSRQGQGAGHRAQGRRREGAPGRPGPAGPDQGAEGEARRRPGRARADAVEGHR